MNIPSHEALPNRRGLARHLMPTLLAAALAGCGGADTAEPQPGAEIAVDAEAAQRQLEQAADAPTETAQAAKVAPVLPEATAARFLNQATFGSAPADLDVVRSSWRIGWMRRQFNLPVEPTHQQRVKATQAALLAADPQRNPDILRAWDASVWEAYITAPDQLRKRAGYALSQIMVVSYDGLPGLATARSRMAAAYLDALEAGAFGNFRQLLQDVTLSPAMGHYLSHRGNRKADYPGNDASKPPLRVPDENYAREVMQLFTIGLVQLNEDGTPRLGPDGKPQDAYTEDDVRGLARVFTGWDWLPRSNPDWMVLPMQHIAERHAPEEKRFLDKTIQAGTPGPESLKIALDTLFNHPNVGPFIGRQLIQRLVTSNPSPAYVRRVAARFANNGKGVRGDMKAVLDAVLRDPEAMAVKPLTAPEGWGKLREPVLRYTTFLRAFGARVDGPILRIPAMTDPATRLGQSPLQAPSVFNFYRPGYVPPNTAIAERGLVAPEFQITTETSVAGYVNFMAGQVVDPEGGIQVDYSAELALATDVPALVQRLNLRVANQALSPATLAAVQAAVAALPSATAAQRLNRVRTAILMVLAAPEFIVQK